MAKVKKAPKSSIDAWHCNIAIGFSVDQAVEFVIGGKSNCSIDINYIY